MGYTTLNGNLNWRDLNYTIYDEGNGVYTEYCTYSQIRQNFIFDIKENGNIEVNDLIFECDIYFKQDINNNALINSSKTAGYNVNIGYYTAGDTSFHYIEDFDYTFTKKSDNLTWHLSIKVDNTFNAYKISIYTPITFISSYMFMDNINFKINDEIYVFMEDFREKVDELNDVINGYQYKVDEFNQRYIENKNTVLSTIVMPNAGYTVIPSILSATVFAPFMAIIGYAILSFILYGRK